MRGENRIIPPIGRSVKRAVAIVPAAAARAARGLRCVDIRSRRCVGSTAQLPIRGGVASAVRYVLRCVLIVLYTVFWGTLACIVAGFDRSGEVVLWIGRTWVRWILRSCGVQVLVEGLANIDRSQPCVFMSNHQSAFDIAAIAHTLPVSFRFVAKREIAWIPIFGWAVAWSGHILVDRGRREKAIRSLDRAAERVRAGTNVIIFPEGTRSANESLRDFKSGGFHLASKARVPILPVSVSGSHRITPRRSLRVESGVIKVVYGKPIPSLPSASEADRLALEHRVREAILAGLDPSFQEVGAVGRTAPAP